MITVHITLPFPVCNPEQSVHVCNERPEQKQAQRQLRLSACMAAYHLVLV